MCSSSCPECSGRGWTREGSSRFACSLGAELADKARLEQAAAQAVEVLYGTESSTVAREELIASARIRGLAAEALRALKPGQAIRFEGPAPFTVGRRWLGRMTVRETFELAA